jgi:hypothetical protein
LADRKERKQSINGVAKVQGVGNFSGFFSTTPYKLNEPLITVVGCRCTTPENDFTNSLKRRRTALLTAMDGPFERRFFGVALI